MKILIALFLFFVLANPLPAQQSMSLDAKRDIDISRKMINDKRNTAIAYNMSFTQQEKEKFWPLYREYREAMWAVGDKRLAVLVDYADNIDVMTDKLAKKLLDRSFAVEKEITSTKQKYAGKFGRILPATKVVRLMQIENRMDAMVDLKIAEGVPLME